MPKSKKKASKAVEVVAEPVAEEPAAEFGTALALFPVSPGIPGNTYVKALERVGLASSQKRKKDERRLSPVLHPHSPLKQLTPNHRSGAAPKVPTVWISLAFISVKRRPLLLQHLLQVWLVVLPTRMDL